MASKYKIVLRVSLNDTSHNVLDLRARELHNIELTCCGYGKRLLASSGARNLWTLVCIPLLPRHNRSSQHNICNCPHHESRHENSAWDKLKDGLAWLSFAQLDGDHDGNFAQQLSTLMVVNFNTQHCDRQDREDQQYQTERTTSAAHNGIPYYHVISMASCIWQVSPRSCQNCQDGHTPNTDGGQLLSGREANQHAKPSFLSDCSIRTLGLRYTTYHSSDGLSETRFPTVFCRSR